MTLTYVRKQVLLEKEQNVQLEKIAFTDGISFSELVRTFLNSQLRVRMYKEMELAADALFADYSSDKDLTDLTLLDGEDVIDG